MYAIEFYTDSKGRKPVKEYIVALAGKNDKDSRIRFDKINDYLEALAEHGATLGEPYMKKLDKEIWELRPSSDRILFAAWTGRSFLLISHFVKKTQKTPSREIEKAKRLLKDYRKRSGDNGEAV